VKGCLFSAQALVDDIVAKTMDVPIVINRLCQANERSSFCFWQLGSINERPQLGACCLPKLTCSSLNYIFCNRTFTNRKYGYANINSVDIGYFMNKFALVSSAVLLACSANTVQAAVAPNVPVSYTIQAYKGSELVLSGVFSLLHSDPATVSVYSQTATLQSATLKLGSTNFSVANTGLFKNTSPYTYADKDLYQLYGIVGTGLGKSTGVGGATDDFSLTFNPYTGAVANLLYATATPGISGTFADRIVLSPLVSAAPEPATWGMMILGFGLAGVAMRRRVRFTKMQTA
jgi:hypothetical protein